MTALLLGIGAMLGPLTPSTIAHALQSTRPADVDHWCKTHLGITLPSPSNAGQPSAQQKTG